MSKYRVSKLSDEEIGELTERMLIAAAARYPAKWLVKIERSPFAWDMRGADTILDVRYPNDDVVRVPVQVKSSEHWRQDFIRKKPHLIAEGLIVLVVGPKHNDVEICLNLYSEIEKVRKEDRCFDKLRCRFDAPVVGNGIEGCKKVERNRKLNPINPHVINRTSVPSWINLHWTYRW